MGYFNVYTLGTNGLMSARSKRSKVDTRKSFYFPRSIFVSLERQLKIINRRLNVSTFGTSVTSLRFRKKISRVVDHVKTNEKFTKSDECFYALRESFCTLYVIQ